MKRVRLTIRHDPNDPADDLRYAAKVRRDLWAHSPVEVDPDSLAHRTRRDAERNAYFEFATNYEDRVDRVLDEYGHRSRVTKRVYPTEVTECINCGNEAGPDLWTVCPICRFREISTCPYCNQEVARQAYLLDGGDLFRCPMCHHRVRLQFHDPLFDGQGQYHQPLVIVERMDP